jgi:uncharacterized protein YbcC (UPF0753/DUF2309 family)
MTQNSNILGNLDNKGYSFNEYNIIHKLKHYLPSQKPLKDFIHHNTLHSFQNMKFYDGIFKASKMFGYKVTLQLNEYKKMLKTNRIRSEILERVIKERKGEENYNQWYFNVLNKKYDSCINPRIGKLRTNWKKAYRIDLDNLVQPLLFRIICSYLDQGIALWHFPFETQGLLNAIRELEKNSFTSFFKTKRAKKLLFDSSCTIEKLLNIIVGDESFFEQYLFDQQFSHRGWSGMVSTIEDNPESILYSKKISLQDFILFELLLELDVLDYEFGEKWQPLSVKANLEHINLFSDTEITEFHEVLMIWQDAFEWSYYDQILYAVQNFKINKISEEIRDKKQKLFQAIFCIDERECSLRRYIEEISPDCETLGSPGFFGVEFYFHPTNGKFYEKLCPAPVTPKYLIKEVDSKHIIEHEILYNKKSHKFFEGFATSISLGIWAAFKLVSNIFNPTMSPAIHNAFNHMAIHADLTIENKDLNDKENNLQIGFTVNEMADRVEAFLKSIGLIENFSSIVYLIAHGSSSANNPYHGAYDCGACNGRPGSVNARVFAFAGNHIKVREILNSRGLNIPLETQFLASLHNTASDEIIFYDENILSKKNREFHKKNKKLFDSALDLNAKERSRRFVSINTRDNIKKVRENIKKRAVSYFEPRPELGHSTNALCFVGHRNLTKGLFLDRRAFMNSYDYRKDLNGKILLGVMKALTPVCGGINLEYYFSRVDNSKLGSGTKLPHNIMGLIGVANSSDGDLRTGLPSQMIEVHDPVRLIILIEHYPEIVLSTIKILPELYEWFINDWVHLMVINPDNNQFYFFKNGEFTLYKPLHKDTPKCNNINNLIESAQKMETNYIVNATQENIPVHIITKG